MSYWPLEQLLETFVTLSTLNVWPLPLFMLEPLLDGVLALELGLLAEAELLALELPEMRTSSPTWLANFEVSPARVKVVPLALSFSV